MADKTRQIRKEGRISETSKGKRKYPLSSVNGEPAL